MANGSSPRKRVFSRSDSEEPTLLERLLEHSAFQFVAFALFVAALVAIVTAGFDSASAGIDSSDIGEPARHTIRAHHAFTVTETDLEASEKERQEAARSVPPVFNWNEGQSDAYRDRIGRAFTDMRSALAARAKEHFESEKPTRLEELRDGSDESLSQKTLIQALPDTKRIGFARSLRAEHFDKHLIPLSGGDGSTDDRKGISEANFDTLARDGFSPTAENALTSILETVMEKAIIPNADLGRVDEDRGIYLRRLRDGNLLVEYHLQEVDRRLVPLRNVPGLVREAAPQALNSIQSEALKSAVVSTSVTLVEPNATFDKSRTADKREAARTSVSESAKQYQYAEGEVIVERGHRITKRHVEIIEEMHDQTADLNRVQIVAGTVFLALLLIVTLFSFGWRNIREFTPSTKDVVFGATTLLLFLLVTQLATSLAHAVADQLAVGSARTWYYLMPVAASGMLIRLVLNNEHAVIFTIIFSLLAGVVADNSLYYASYTAVGTLVGVATVQQVKHRMALMWSGLTVGAVNAGTVLAILLLQGEFFQTATFGAALVGFGGGLLSGLVVLSILPVFEAIFDYTTDIKLLELANLNHPVLRELIMRAPGSYHHSMMVGSLCEAAAEAVGANPLLARVGAYYHDIGKAKNPKYFAENQRPGENPHDNLKPNMSALIIKNHVKDGLEMAREHGLPTELRDFIAQHHGTSLISYFYHRAKEMEDPDVPEVDEDDYRYPGPKPQTRETAICLLADGVEAASRAMPEPTPARLKGLVQRMINKAFTDGQLDECDLTLRDLNAIAEALTRILVGTFHQRPEYPDEDKDRQERMDRANDTPDEGKDRELEAAEETKGFADDQQIQHSRDAADVAPDSDSTTGSDHANSHRDEGDRDRSSGDRDDGGDDSDESRESLPRLGSG